MASEAFKKILVVEDEEEVLVFVGNILKRANYEVYSTTSGKEAVAISKRVIPDMIVLDIILPDIDGGKVAEILYEDKTTTDIPILFLTGLITKVEEQLVKKIGKRYIMAKPITEEELLNMVKRILYPQTSP